MRVKLDDEHTLVSDSNCCWIVKKYVTDKGRESERRVSGYYTTMADCINSYIDRKILSSEAETIKQLQRDINKLKKQVKNWIKEVKDE